MENLEKHHKPQNKSDHIALAFTKFLRLIADTFLVMNFVKDKEYFNIRYQVKAFMIWILISVLLISLGGLISLLQKKNEK